jgi:hypothetical protein
MSIIRIRKKIESELIHLPELKPLIGKTVQITVQEETSFLPTSKDWSPLIEAAGKDLINPEVCLQYREFDRKHWNLKISNSNPPNLP